MERKEKKIKWRKEGGGSFRMANRKIIKPGQVFEAYPSEIPQAFRDVVVPLDKLPPSPEEEPLDVVESEYFLQSRGAGGWFDVIDANGKVLNEKALKKDKAEEYIAELEK